MMLFRPDCPPGYKKEDYRFVEKNDDMYDDLILMNFNFDQCIERCDGDRDCNFISFSLDLETVDGSLKNGCYIYNEDDNSIRSVKIDPKKEIFCNKLGGGI